MAGNAAIDSAGWMLMKEWAAFFAVARDAGLGRLVEQAGVVRCSVGIMAIGTIHEAFRHTMVNRKREFPLNGAMTRVTQRRLRGFQEAVSKPLRLIGLGIHLEDSRLNRLQIPFALIPRFIDQMRAVTGIARDSVSRMFGMGETLLQFSNLMASEAAIRVLFCRTVKTENQSVRGQCLCFIPVGGLFGIGMRGSRTMTLVTTAIGMNGLAEFGEFRLMAASAARIVRCVCSRTG